MLIIVECRVCNAPFEADRKCQLVVYGRTYCEAHSVLRGAAWWLIYRKNMSPYEAGRANMELWAEAQRELSASQYKDRLLEVCLEDIRKASKLPTTCGHDGCTRTPGHIPGHTDR